MAANQDRLVALLVDLENVAGLELQRVFEVAATEGQVVVRRVYGEFNLVASRKQHLQDLAFDQSALFNTTSQSRKNGADIFLAIEAMDLLHRQVKRDPCPILRPVRANRRAWPSACRGEIQDHDQEGGNP